MTNFSIIETGGKQYIVKTGDKIQVEKLSGNAGDAIKFDKVLFSTNDKDIKIGKPFVGFAAEGKILKQAKGDKIYVLKYKSKSKYRRKIGHRQEYTEVEIIKA